MLATITYLPIQEPLYLNKETKLHVTHVTHVLTTTSFLPSYLEHAFNGSHHEASADGDEQPGAKTEEKHHEDD
jgi:hypothetical protein